MDTTPSGYQDGKTLGEVAAERVQHLLAAARANTLNNETAYGYVERRAATFTLAGGGPAADVTIIYDGEPTDGDVVEGWYGYYEMSGSAALYLRREEAKEIHQGLWTDAEDQREQAQDDD